MAAQIVAAALHVANRESLAKKALEERNIFEEELLLQGLGVGRNHHSLAGQDGWNQVGQSLACARSRLDNQALLLPERSFHRLRHFQLPGTEFVVGMCVPQQTVSSEKSACREAFCGGRLRGENAHGNSGVRILSVVRIGPGYPQKGSMAPVTAPVTTPYLYISELLGVRVFDTKGRRIGALRDAAIVPLIDAKRVDRYLVGAGPGWLSIRYDQVREIGPEGIHLKDERLTPYHSDEYMLRIVRDLLDQQIIDAQGRKLVRVNDVTLTSSEEEGFPVLRVLEVDIGVRSMLRRVLRGVVPATTIRKLQDRIPPHSISWDFCNILEPDPQRRVRLNISNKLLEDMHPADLADIVENLGHEDRTAIFNTMDSETAADLLSEVDRDMQTQIIESLETDKAADILEEMEPSEAADVLHELEHDKSEEILDEMEPEDKQDLEELLEFRDDTAGGLMDTGYVQFPVDATVADAMRELKQQEQSLENIHDLFVVDTQERLVSVVPLAKLLFAPGETKLTDRGSDDLVYVHSDDKQDRVAEMFDKYNLLSLPVVDDDLRLIGAITVDDIVTLLRHR